MKKALYLSLCLAVVMAVGAASAGLASMLGISSAAALKVINIIDTVSTVALIISLIAVIIGAGVITTGLVATAKKLIVKYGKKYAAMW